MADFVNKKIPRFAEYTDMELYFAALCGVSGGAGEPSEKSKNKDLPQNDPETAPSERLIKIGSQICGVKTVLPAV